LLEDILKSALCRVFVWRLFRHIHGQRKDEHAEYKNKSISHTADFWVSPKPLYIANFINNNKYLTTLCSH